MTTHDVPDTHATANTYASTFSAETRRELSQEDSEAWRAIVTLLLGIISVGVVLAVVCVLLTSR